ncbi:MAG: DUF3037 domain-containing protein [Terracidiphilus sp.]
MKNMAYQFSVLRYVHDTVTQEFVNIGVAMFAPDSGFLRARCTESYARISDMFLKIDGPGFRHLTHYIESQICAQEKRFNSPLKFDQPPTLGTILAQVLPADDSAFRFSDAGVGLSVDLNQTFSDLYHRHVETYLHGERTTRNDDDVWSVFREPLDRRNVTPLLKPHRIIAPNFDYEFKRSWKNEVWHLYEPVSFDLVEANAIPDKANRWFGRAANLLDSPDRFRIYFLLGEPRDPASMSAFRKAQNILNKIPAQKDFIKESERDSFADDLAREIREHSE